MGLTSFLKMDKQQSQEDGVSASPPEAGGHSEEKEVPASPPEAACSPDSSREGETEGSEMSVEHGGDKEAPTSSTATSTATKPSGKKKKKKKKKKKRKKKAKGMIVAPYELALSASVRV